MSKHLVNRLVLTGGPCGGKTSAIPFLEEKLTALGYKVIILPEAASELVNSGIKFNDLPVNDFQDLVMKRIIYYEEQAKKFADFYQQDVIILEDRGLLDNKAYMPYDDFIKVLAKNGYTEKEAKDSYDAVFHLVTAALGAEEFYKLDGTRHETPEEARELDLKNLQAWLHHPKHTIIDNSTNFDEKMNRLLNKILEIVG